MPLSTGPADRPAIATDAPRRFNTAAWTLLLAACCVVAALSRAGFLAEPWQNDAGIYIEMGKVLTEGQAGLYRVIWDTKFPGVALLTAPLWLLFGSAWWGYVLTQAILAFAASFLFASVARRRVGPGAYWPVLLTSLVYLNLSRVVLTGFQLETLMAVFSTVAACCVLNALPTRNVWWWIGAGAFAGLAALAKPTGLSVAAAAGVAAVWPALFDRRQWAGAAVGLAGLAAGVALVLVPVATWSLTAPFAGELPEVYRQIVLYGSGTPWRQVFAPKVGLLFALPLVPVAARLVHHRLAPSERESTDGFPAAILAFAVSWLLVECVGVVLQKRVYAYHFLPTFPPAALLCGLVPVRPKPLVLAVGLLPAIGLSLAWSQPMLARLGDPPRMAGVNAYLDEHAKPGESVWADPGPPVTIPTDLRPGMRLAFLHYFLNYDAAPTDFAARVIDDLQTRRPEWAVVLNPTGQEGKIADMEAQPGVALNPLRRRNLRAGFAAVLGHLDAHYEQVEMIGGYRILRRR